MNLLTPEVNERANKDRMLSSRVSDFPSRLPLCGGAASRIQKPGHPPPPPPPPASSPPKTRPCGESPSRSEWLNVFMETLFEEYKRMERRSSLGRHSTDDASAPTDGEDNAIHCSSSSSSDRKKTLSVLQPSSFSSFSDRRFQRLTTGMVTAMHSSVTVSDECLTDAKDRHQVKPRSSLLKQPGRYGRQVQMASSADRDDLPVQRTGRASLRQFVPPKATGTPMRCRSGEPASRRCGYGGGHRRARSHDDSFGSTDKIKSRRLRQHEANWDRRRPSESRDCRQEALPKPLSSERQKPKGEQSANGQEKQRRGGETEKGNRRNERGKGGGEGGRIIETSPSSSCRRSLPMNGRRNSLSKNRSEETRLVKTSRKRQNRSEDSNRTEQRQSRIPLLMTTIRQQLNTRSKTTEQQLDNSSTSESENNDMPSSLLSPGSLLGPQTIVISNNSI